LLSYSADTFYHIRLEFNCSSDSQSIWINNINVLTDASYQFATTEFGSMCISTSITEKGIDAFLDAIAFSWDPYYEIGQSMQEGILLSFTTSLELTEMAYVLDNQPMIPILGNKTIPMCSDGEHELQIYANDSVGNLLVSNLVLFSLDTIIPEIIIDSPLTDDTFEMTPPDFEVTIVEANLNTTWYTVDEGGTNITFSGNTGTIDYSEWTALPNGPVTLTFYANDSLGLIGSSSVLIQKNVAAPILTIDSPNIDDIFEMLPPEFEVTIVELNLDTAWYTVDGGVTNITFSGTTGTIDYSAWNALPNGPVTLTVYANDTFGLVGSDSVIIQKNATAPILIINYPGDGEFFGSFAPAFDLTITELNLDKTWYSLDGGMTNITFTGSTGMIDQAQWDTLPCGPVSIRFYANDSSGLQGFAEVTINKDIDAPTCSVTFTPHSGTNIVNKTTLFYLTADDGIGCGVSSIKYRINNSAWTDYTNPFALTSYSPGDYFIEYYAIDELGNQGTYNSITATLIDIEPKQPPLVPGFYPILIIGVASIMILYYMRKIKKSN
jgi:hypothetical protein